MGKELLITGGAGFIGANFIQYILDHTTYSVTNIDSLTYAANNNQVENHKYCNRYRFIQCDIRDKSSLSKVFDREYDAIINFAAESHVDRSIDDALPFIETNINGTFHLLQAVLENKAKKMIQISTDEVYGSLRAEDPPFTEENSLSPNNPYSASKASADLLVRSFYNTHKIPLLITRCSNNFGPKQHEEKLIPKVIIRALENQRIPLYGDGLNIRDWLFVEDHCRAIHMVLENGKYGEVYNIGGADEKTNLEIIEEILNYLNKPKSLIDYVDDRKGHDRRYAMNASKIRNELGWYPQYSFQEGIQKTILWYKNQLSERG